MCRTAMNCILVAFLLVSTVAPQAAAQRRRPTPKPLPENGIKLGEPVTTQWQAGLIITAKGPCTGIIGTVPVPTDWPEQTVKIVHKEVTPGVRYKFQTIAGGVRQMVVSISSLRAGATAQAVLTFEVTRRAIHGPDDTTQFSIPKRTSRTIGKFLGESPYIQSRNGEIVAAAKAVLKGQDDATDWEKVEMLYDWTRKTVEYRNGKLKGALRALRDGYGDCEELTALFVAACRVHKIPARMVWVPDHAYPEFYLVDKQGQGHWFPCQAAGDKAFGSMPEVRPVLQKGDNFRVPGKKGPQHYVAEHLKVKGVKGGSPTVRFIRKHIN